MKKILSRICGAFLLCAFAAGFASSCQKDTPPVVNPADIELSDYEWDIDFPYEVYLSPGVAAELKEAYGDFIAAPAGTISENTYMVILDKLGDLPEDKGFTYYVVSGSDRFICRALVQAVGIAPNREKALKLGEQWREAGYKVISMRDDFRTIYGDGVVKTGFTFPTE
ncbi:MAG: hypothetical protein IJV37_08630 [Bacteroidales bacterium]|nr:hypothetical protein [Bacteroidales bacterium]